MPERGDDINRSLVRVMDGGMGKELKRIGAPFRQPEWSALALMEGPEWVLTAHRNFVDAGAEIIITNAYAIVPFHLGEATMAERGFELAALAGKLAREAADSAEHRVCVAGSLPPLFGSYEPEQFVPEAAPAHYRTLIEAQAPHVDLWLAETVSSIAELKAIVDAVTGWDVARRPLWVAFTVADELSEGEPVLRSGEPLQDAVAALRLGDGPVEGLLFNCSQPEPVTAAVEHAAPLIADHLPELTFGAYANAFEPKPEVYSANEVILGTRADLTPERYAEIARRWVDAGANVVGGCCNIRPDHIQALAEEFGAGAADG